MHRKFAFVTAGVAAAVLAVAGIAGVAAQTSGDGASTASPLSGFVDRLAGKLGIGPDALKTAIQQTRDEMIDEAVANGTITAERGQALKDKALGDNLGKGFEFHGVGPNGGTFEFHARGAEGDGPKLEGKAFAGRGGPFALQAVGDAIGIDVPTLLSELSSGKTLAQVAAAHGVSRDQLKQALTNKVTANLDTLLDQGFPVPMERKGGPGSMGQPAPAVTATPQS